MIDLGRGFVLSADDCAYIVGNLYTNPKTGKEVIKHPFYYTRLDDALNGTLDRMMKAAVADNEVTSIEGLIDLAHKMKVNLESLLPLFEFEKEEAGLNEIADEIDDER